MMWSVSHTLRITG